MSIYVNIKTLAVVFYAVIYKFQHADAELIAAVNSLSAGRARVCVKRLIRTSSSAVQTINSGSRVRFHVSMET